MTQDKAHPTPPAVPSDGLLPCPFCGHDSPEFERMGTAGQSCIVICGDCGARHESGDEYLRSGQSWNTRAVPVASNTTAEPAPIQPAGVEVESLPELPESVGNGWMDCEDCEGHGIAGEPLYMGTHQPPEYEDCGSCNGSGRWRATFYTADQLRAYALQAIRAAASQGDRGKT